ncbi:MAG: hypothetical protein ACOCVJ_01355 [Verrucomicrobiota bacterium]
MNKIYDKIILVAALIALGAGAAVYLMQSGAAVEPADPSISGNPYEPIDASLPEQEEANWPPAQHQGEDPQELFDVFTPPKIYIDEDGNFVFEAPDVGPPPPPEPFGVYLAEMRRDPYRIQLEGYIEDDLTDASKSLLLLYDEEQERSVRARVGEEMSEHDFKVLDFTISRVRDEDNVVTRSAEATILDQRTGEEVVLTHGERLFEEDYDIVIADSDSDETVEVSEAGDEFTFGENSYILRKINLEESSVTVEKLGDEENEAVVEVLSVESGPTSSPSPETPQTQTDDTETEPEDAAEAFDFF